MRTLFRSLLVLALGLATCAVAAADEKEKAKELLGLWKRTAKIKDKDVTVELEFLPEGKLRIEWQVDKNDTVLKGTWKVADEDHVEMTWTLDNKAEKKRCTFSINKDELKLTDPTKNETETYKRDKK
jgi:uncharacterized protein (TIGR03066 family)